MIDGSRYFTYVIISIWKILVFMAMAWGLTFYTGILLEPYTLFTKVKNHLQSLFGKKKLIGDCKYV